MEQPKYVVLDARQTVMQSIVADGATFGFLMLCIWVSQGSRWWTFFTALMFLAYLGFKAASVVQTRQHKFKNLDALAAWVESEQANAEVTG